MFWFFAYSELFEKLAFRPLAHIRPNWELDWDAGNETFVFEEDSVAVSINTLLLDLKNRRPRGSYHVHEDRLAEFTRVRLKWPIRKVGGRWVGSDYASILEQGAFDDLDCLIDAAAGRIHAARSRGQSTFEEMDDSHQRMLADVIAAILYHYVTLEPSPG